jgi:hypothetical protein
MIDQSTSGLDYRIQRYSNTSNLEFFDGTNTINGGTISTSSWNHIGVTIYYGTCTLYINGTQVAQSSCKDPLSSSGGSTYIGRYSGSGALYQGYMGAIQMYNRGLSATEISQNFNAQRANYGI